MYRRWCSIAPQHCAFSGSFNNDNDNESEFVLAYWHEVMKSSLICYCHRQSGSTAYRLQARPALTGPGLRLTAMPRLNLPFNGCYPLDPWSYMVHYSFTDPGGMEGWVGLVGWPAADALSTKWSHVNHRSGVDQGKSASHRPTSWPLSHCIIIRYLSHSIRRFTHKPCSPSWVAHPLWPSSWRGSDLIKLEYNKTVCR